MLECLQLHKHWNRCVQIQQNSSNRSTHEWHQGQREKNDLSPAGGWPLNKAWCVCAAKAWYVWRLSVRSACYLLPVESGRVNRGRVTRNYVCFLTRRCRQKREHAQFSSNLKIYGCTFSIWTAQHSKYTGTATTFSHVQCINIHANNNLFSHQCNEFWMDACCTLEWCRCTASLFPMNFTESGCGCYFIF